jgi:hypothetical protein
MMLPANVSSVPALSPLATVRSHSVGPSPMRWPCSMSAAAAFCSQRAPAATSRPIFERSCIELVVAGALRLPGKDVGALGAALRAIGSGPLRDGFGPLWTTFWDEELNEPTGRGSELFEQSVDPAVTMTTWMNGRRADHVTASATEVEAGENAGSVAEASGHPRPVATTGPRSWSLPAGAVPTHRQQPRYQDRLRRRRFQFAVRYSLSNDLETTS